MLAPATPLDELHGIPPRFLPKLARMGIRTAWDLLTHFPTRYEDYSQIYKIADLIPNQEATIEGEVRDVGGRRAWRRRLYVVEALISDDSGSIRAVWFNQPYVRNILTVGRRANFAGKVTSGEGGELYLSNPTYELTTNNRQRQTANGQRPTTLHTGRIVPIYPETRGFTSKGIRMLIRPLLEAVALKETIPPGILAREGLPPLPAALRAIHFPETVEDAVVAKRRFAFEDLFLLQLQNLRERAALAREQAPAIPTDIPYVKRLLSALPFTLTPSQKVALWEIIQDLARPHPMNRLLQGDVGSGKTVVAAVAALLTAKAGHQAAFMAPTEILARQHYATFRKFFGDFEGGAALLTGSESRATYGHGLETEMKKTELRRAIENGTIAIAIGTHALIQKTVTFPALAFIVVDEQHRFGVRQRAELAKHGDLVPHFLSMSATPIPRTLSLTVFGDLDLSLITELPKDRKAIITKVVSPENREKAYAFIRGEVRKGRQVFVICPRIEQTTDDKQLTTYALRALEMKNVTEEHEKLSKKVFPDLKVAMLHGKLKSKEKERIMRAFADGETGILVSTSVVEVGVDIQNATVMMIESAERFGLAQLYQFRGRVGRGAHQSYCLLFTEATGRIVAQRLRAVAEATSGLELAEKDLTLRGPGQFLGETQSGMPDIAMKAIQNPDIVKRARDTAVELLRKDPDLKSFPLLRERLEEFEARVHWE